MDLSVDTIMLKALARIDGPIPCLQTPVVAIILHHLAYTTTTEHRDRTYRVGCMLLWVQQPAEELIAYIHPP